MTTRNNWSKEEIILALGLYSITPYGRITSTNPLIQALAVQIGRSPGAVSFKLANLADLDPRVAASGRRGFSNGGKTDKAVWNDYFDSATGVLDTDRLMTDIVNVANENGLTTSFLCDPDGNAILPATDIGSPDTQVPEFIDGKIRNVTVKQRVNQSVFRTMVLNNFHHSCVISGLAESHLVEAAHILPWSESADHRIDVRNGLALNVLMHRAYDANLLGIDGDGRIRLSPRLMHERTFSDLDGHVLNFGSCRFRPCRDFLAQRFEAFQEAVL